MSINDVGATAFLIAGIRAREELQDEPLFSDPHACLFVNDEWQERVQALLDVHFAIGDAIRIRTMALNRLLEEEIARGVRQIVTLGCGFDMRHEIYKQAGVRFFDVDQPAVLDFKADVLEKAGLAPCPAVGCDYLEADLPERLQEAGFDPDVETLFVWEGNTMYLPKQKLFRFLESLCARMGRFRIGFDYLLKSVLDGAYDDAEAVEVVRSIQQALGAKFQAGFDTLEQFETDLPFRVIEAGNILDIGLRDDKYGKSVLSNNLSEAFAGIYRLALIERG